MSECLEFRIDKIIIYPWSCGIFLDVEILNYNIIIRNIEIVINVDPEILIGIKMPLHWNPSTNESIFSLEFTDKTTLPQLRGYITHWTKLYKKLLLQLSKSYEQSMDCNLNKIGD